MMWFDFDPLCFQSGKYDQTKFHSCFGINTIKQDILNCYKYYFYFSFYFLFYSVNHSCDAMFI